MFQSKKEGSFSPNILHVETVVVLFLHVNLYTIDLHLYLHAWCELFKEQKLYLGT